MAAYFFDSSALVKRYVSEIGSAFVAGLLAPAAGHEIHVLRIADAHELRAYDALQLAGAAELNHVRSVAGLAPAIVVSADQELNAAALAEGMAVDDSNAHP